MRNHKTGGVRLRPDNDYTVKCGDYNVLPTTSDGVVQYADSFEFCLALSMHNDASYWVKVLKAPRSINLEYQSRIRQAVAFHVEQVAALEKMDISNSRAGAELISYVTPFGYNEIRLLKTFCVWVYLFQYHKDVARALDKIVIKDMQTSSDATTVKLAHECGDTLNSLALWKRLWAADLEDHRQFYENLYTKNSGRR
jgi:hypothetical protein